VDHILQEDITVVNQKTSVLFLRNVFFLFVLFGELVLKRVINFNVLNDSFFIINNNNLNFFFL
jgi:hypothetical protein